MIRQISDDVAVMYLGPDHGESGPARARVRAAAPSLHGRADVGDPGARSGDRGRPPEDHPRRRGARARAPRSRAASSRAAAGFERGSATRIAASTRSPCSGSWRTGTSSRATSRSRWPITSRAPLHPPPRPRRQQSHDRRATDPRPGRRDRRRDRRRERRLSTSRSAAGPTRSCSSGSSSPAARPGTQRDSSRSCARPTT